MIMMTAISCNDAQVELQQLRYVLAVARTRNFTRAAGQCHVVQSALSQQIKVLEAELGTALFARTSRRVEITAAGERFLVHARAALEAVDRAAAEARATSGEVVGRLRLGLIPTVTAFDVPAVLGSYRRAYPRVAMSIGHGVSAALVRDVAGGGVDVAVLGTPEDPPRVAGVATRVLARQRHVALVGSGHRLLGRRRITMQDLAGESFVDFPEGSGGREQTDRAFARAGVARTVVFEVAGTDLMYGLVAEGIAVALLPDAVTQGRADLVSLPVEDGPTRVESLAWDGFNPSPAAMAFLDTLAREAQTRATPATLDRGE